MVPTSGLADAIKQTRELQHLLGKKTMKAETLKEAVEVTRSRKWIARSILSPEGATSGTDQLLPWRHVALSPTQSNPG